MTEREFTKFKERGLLESEEIKCSGLDIILEKHILKEPFKAFYQDGVYFLIKEGKRQPITKEVFDSMEQMILIISLYEKC